MLYTREAQQFHTSCSSFPQSTSRGLNERFPPASPPITEASNLTASSADVLWEAGRLWVEYKAPPERIKIHHFLKTSGFKDSLPGLPIGVMHSEHALPACERHLVSSNAQEMHSCSPVPVPSFLSQPKTTSMPPRREICKGWAFTSFFSQRVSAPNPPHTLLVGQVMN